MSTATNLLERPAKLVQQAPRKTPKEKSFIFRKYVGTMRAKPQTKLRMSLGTYTPENPAKGFSIKLTSDVCDENGNPAVTTEVISSGGRSRYEVMLCLTNLSHRSVSAEVWGI